MIRTFVVPGGYHQLARVEYNTETSTETDVLKDGSRREHVSFSGSGRLAEINGYVRNRSWIETTPTSEVSRMGVKIIIGPVTPPPAPTIGNAQYGDVVSYPNSPKDLYIVLQSRDSLGRKQVVSLNSAGRGTIFPQADGIVLGKNHGPLTVDVV